MAVVRKSEPTVEKLGPYDILCGRCKTAYHNVGNRRFRVTMNLNLDAYMQTKSKSERSVLIASIVMYLTDEVGARFLKPHQKKGFVELDEPQAREKVGHALRDMAVAKKRTTVTEWSKRGQQQDCLVQLQRRYHLAQSHQPFHQQQHQIKLQPDRQDQRLECDYMFQLQQSKLRLEWTKDEMQAGKRKRSTNHQDYIVELNPQHQTPWKNVQPTMMIQKNNQANFFLGREKVVSNICGSSAAHSSEAQLASVLNRMAAGDWGANNIISEQPPAPLSIGCGGYMN